MATERQLRIESLAEQEFVRRKLPSFLLGLQTAIDSKISEEFCLPRQKSLELREKAQRFAGQAMLLPSGIQHVVLDSEHGSRFFECLEAIAGAVDKNENVLSLGRFDQFPLVRVKATAVVDRFYPLWRFGDTLSVFSSDAEKGFLADWYPDDRDQSFEIASWGLN